MQLSDRVTGLFLVALGSAAAYGGWLLPPVPGQQIGPNVFPLVIGIGLVLCGAMIALGVGRSFEEEVGLVPDQELEPAAPRGEAEEPAGSAGWAHGLLALVPPGLLLFYVFAADRLGFAITAAAMVLTTALALGARLRLAVPLAIAAPLFVHLVFSKLLRVPLPAGLLPLPW
jgi:putative tricarboxylic transport membrane protein